MDLESKTISAEVRLPKLKFYGQYSVDTQIGGFEIKGNGPAAANLTDCDLNVVIEYKIVKRNGQEYMKLTACDIAVRVGDYHVSLEDGFNGDKTLGNVALAVIHANKQDILAFMKPTMKEIIGREVLEVGNLIVSFATYSEIMPES